MAYRDTEVPVPGFPGAVLLPAPDWPRGYEQAVERAEATEARAEELKWAEVAARTEAGRYRGLFEAARRKRLAAAEARRAAKNARALEAEVRRLRRLFEDAGVESGRGGVAGLRRENARLRPLRHEEPPRQTQEGHLAAAPVQGLEAHSQPVDATTLPP